MSRELVELKREAETLVDSIEAIQKESISFADAKGELKNLTEQLSGICSDLNTVILNSETLISEVNEIAVRNTIQKLKDTEESIAKIVEESREIAQATKTNVDAAVLNIDGKLKSADEKLTKAIKDITLRVMIMGGVAVACSIVALIISLTI